MIHKQQLKFDGKRSTLHLNKKVMYVEILSTFEHTNGIMLLNVGTHLILTFHTFHAQWPLTLKLSIT